MEIWDGYRSDSTLAGCDIIRDEKMPENIYHIVSEVIVHHKDGDYLLMQRDYIKKKYPGLYEASASGSALKGETPMEAAKRELKEETGSATEQLTFISKSTDPSTQGLYYIYLCEAECDKESITLQGGETISYKWLSKVDFLEFVQSDNYIKDDRERKKVYLDSIR